MNVKHIVFPLDYSEACRRAAPCVEIAARNFGARLSLLHVLGPFPACAGDMFQFLSDSEMQMLLSRERDALYSFARQVFSNDIIESSGKFQAVTHLEGEPAAKIVQYATEHDADLIMMPTHGLGTFRRLLIGSVTAKVLHDAPMPVWTSIHRPQVTESGANVFSERILCAIDFGPRSMQVLRTARWLAERLRAKWCVLHAVERDGNEEQARADAMRLLDEAGISAPVCVGYGRAASAIRQHARETGSDLVVIGRGCLTENWGRLRTNVYAIIRESPCPVLSV
jgi:nucleotide-binding universal stress UspA family protein